MRQSSMRSSLRSPPSPRYGADVNLAHCHSILARKDKCQPKGVVEETTLDAHNGPALCRTVIYF